MSADSAIIDSWDDGFCSHLPFFTTGQGAAALADSWEAPRAAAQTWSPKILLAARAKTKGVRKKRKPAKAKPAEAAVVSVVLGGLCDLVPPLNLGECALATVKSEPGLHLLPESSPTTLKIEHKNIKVEQAKACLSPPWEGLSSEDEMQETETEAGAREQWCVPSNPPPRLVLE